MAVRKKHNWPELIKEQELSGETVDAFCKVRKIHSSNSRSVINFNKKYSSKSYSTYGEVT